MPYSYINLLIDADDIVQDALDANVHNLAGKDSTTAFNQLGASNWHCVGVTLVLAHTHKPDQIGQYTNYISRYTFELDLGNLFQNENAVSRLSNPVPAQRLSEKS